MPAHSKKATISDIAKYSGVSAATVSRVLNGNRRKYSEETEKKVRAVMREFDYRPLHIARSLASKRSWVIGLLVPEIANDFFAHLAKGVEHQLFENGYRLLLASVPSNDECHEDIVEDLLSHPVDGLITACGILKHVRNVEHVPIVYVDRHSLGSKEEYGVFFPNSAVFYHMTKMFHLAGHEKIAIIAGPVSTSTGDERLRGYINYIEESGRLSPIIEFGDYSISSGYDAADKMIRKGEFTALLASNDYMALGAIKRLHESGIRIPDDVEVMGIDNSPFCTVVKPSLSSISQNPFNMGIQAADIIVEALAGHADAIEPILMLSPQCFFRESTSCQYNSEVKRMLDREKMEIFVSEE